MSSSMSGATTQANGHEIIQTRIGVLDFTLGMPTRETVAKLYDEIDFQRAVLCYLWATPIVGMEGVRQALVDNASAGSGDVVLVETYRDVSVMLGSNLTTPYFLAYIDLSRGPVAIEYPPGATAGSLIDWWDRPIADVGLPGLDQGHGATFVLAGPAQDAPRDIPSATRILHTSTRKVLLFCRILDPDPAAAHTVLSGVRIYPHGQGADETTSRLLRFKRQGELTSMAHPSGFPYWERLAQALRDEPIEDRDRFFAAMLQPLGIRNDQPFGPDARQRDLLAQAAIVGEAMAKASAFDKRFPDMRYRADANWEYLIPPSFAVQQDVPDGTRFEERTAFFYEVMGASEGVMTRTPGVGSAYLAAYHDKDGRALDGGQAYRLHVPANPPAKLFWSITLYDVDTRCLIQNTQQIADRSSRGDLLKNPDGSVDIVAGPTAPIGLETNWIPTTPGKAWFAYFRLFGPLQPYFDRTWLLPDIEPAR